MRSSRVRLILFCVFLSVHIRTLDARGKKYYDILDVSEDADDATLKRAYKRLALYTRLTFRAV